MREIAVPLTIMAKEYAKERGKSDRRGEKSARKLLERRLQYLVQQGIVERLNTYPVSYRLKRSPITALLPSVRSFRIRVPFDLSLISHSSQSLGKSQNPKQKIQELRKAGLRVITLANSYRQRALLTAQHKSSIRPGTREYADISFLFEENLREWNNSVMVFVDDFEQYMLTRVRTRFNDRKKALSTLIKYDRALEEAFRKYKDAIMITLTIPHIFPLVVPVKDGKWIIGYVPLQDSIVTQLKSLMVAWIRQNWKGREVRVFTAYEFHNDYTLHVHVIVFGIPYLIDWDRKYGRKKEDALTYYKKRYNIDLSSCPDLKGNNKTKLGKCIFTALLDAWLKKVLTRFDSVLKTNLLKEYLRYKERNGLQGPVNEIHRIRNGRWKGTPPKDSVIEFTAGATYRKVISPKDYVLKYVTKVVHMIAQGVLGDPNESAKVVGYWLFGKRFNSCSPSLLPKEEKGVKLPYWHFVGVFPALEVPDYVTENVVYDFT